jgi:hypothetical protein
MNTQITIIKTNLNQVKLVLKCPSTTLSIGNGNWFNKRISLTNTDVPAQTDGKIKFEALSERAPIRSAKR